MEVKNALMPNDEQMAGFLEKDKDQPIFMVNLLKFKDKAEYPDKRETDLTGAEAYAIYGKEVRKHLEKVEDLWDVVAIATYPNRKAMLDMISDPEYIKSAQHRVAGLEGQLNIETNTPLEI